MNKVVVTRPVDQAEKWLKAINEAGFESVLLPFIQTQKLNLPVTSARNLSLYDAVMLVSASAVKHFSNAIQTLLCGNQLPRFWVTGPGTAQALIEIGVPSRYIDYPDPLTASLDSKGLWQCVQAQLASTQSVLIVRGQHSQTKATGNLWLEQQIQASGISTHTLVVYERQSPSWTPEQHIMAQNLLTQPVIWLLTSSEAIDLAPNLNFIGQKALVTHEKIAKTATLKGFLVQSIVHPSIEKVIAGLKSIT